MPSDLISLQILLALRRLTYGTAINEEEKLNIATSKADTKERANKIALLNDALRQTFTGCVYRKLDSAILVVKATENRV